VTENKSMPPWFAVGGNRAILERSVAKRRRDDAAAWTRLKRPPETCTMHLRRVIDRRVEQSRSPTLVVKDDPAGGAAGERRR